MLVTHCHLSLEPVLRTIEGVRGSSVRYVLMLLPSHDSESAADNTGPLLATTSAEAAANAVAGDILNADSATMLLRART